MGRKHTNVSLEATLDSTGAGSERISKKILVAKLWFGTSSVWECVVVKSIDFDSFAVRLEKPSPKY